MKQDLLNKRDASGVDKESKQPATFADVKVITGDQGGGKSTTTVALGVGAYYDQLNGIVSPNGEFIKAISVAKSVNREDYRLLEKAGIYPHKLKYVRVFSDDGRQSKLIKIPKGWLVSSPVRIFANFHLFGVRFWPISLADIIQYMNTDLFEDAWILADETGEADARYSMNLEGKIGTEFYKTIRKRRAHYCSLAQYSEMLERRIRLFATTRILCSYDEETKYVTCDMRIRGKDEFTTNFWAPQYWRFFDTEELIKVPQYKIDKVLEKMYQS